MIQELACHYPVTTLCNVMEVGRSSYYDWLRKREEREQQETKKAFLLFHIQRVFHSKKQTYGYRRIFQQLSQEKIPCYENQIKKLMQEKQLRVKRRRKFIHTTDSNHGSPISPNLLNQNFIAIRPNQKWVGDITYLESDEGFLYLAVVLDLYSRRVIGWSLQPHMRGDLIIDALQKAIYNRFAMSTFQDRRRQAENPASQEACLIFHSDRGCQYASKEYRSILQNQNILSSMSRKGNCYDNAAMESFFHTLKQECTDHLVKPSRSELKSAIFEYIELFYNRNRLHSTLKYVSPVQFEQLYLEKEEKVFEKKLVVVV
jgi:putative transposase